jgi:small subunit ribosomal protein S14
MAKKSMIEREVKRQKLIQKYLKKRIQLLNELAGTNGVRPALKDQFLISVKLQKLPRNSSPTRYHNRCFVTGRPKGYFRDFGLSRHVLREMAHQCLLPGVTKASW